MRQNWWLAFAGIFLLFLLPTPIKCQQFSSSTTNPPPPPSTTTSLLTLPPEVYRTTSSTSPSGAAISSSSPLDAQIAHLKEDEVLDGRKDREKVKQDELPLAFEDGDESTPMEAFSTTSPMPSTSTLNEGGTIEGEEGGTMRPRQAPDETLPDPGQVADPSLVPVQLMRPDYRPLIAEGPSPIPPPPPPSTPAEEPASSTVEQMGDEGGGETTTTAAAAGETEPEPTTTEAASTAEAEAAQAEAEAKEAEATAAAQEATAAQAEAEAKTQEAEAARNEANAAQEEAEAARNEAGEAQTSTPEPMAQTAENAGSRVAEAVPEGANDGADQQREAIDALTQALQRAQLLVQNITIVMPRDSPSMQAFLGALLASRPAMLAQNAAAQSRQLPPPTAMPMPLPVVASPLPPSTFIPVRPSPLAQPASFDPSSLSQMPMPQNYAFPPNGAAGTATGQQQKRPPRPSYLVEVEQLHSWIKSGRRLKLLDASYEPEAGIPDHIQFYKDYYGKWDKLIRDKKGRQYERSHIPEAIPFNLNIATYPSWNERQALYPPERFEEYVQRLGINRRDQLVIYARGPMAGMLHAARAWFLFRIYGHENVTVLNGGMDAWRRADLPANDQSVETEIGNWTARFRPELVVTFEELTNTDTDGYCILSRLYWYNFLDARPRNEYFGMAGAQMMGQQRNRLAGAKPFPADELVQDGLLVPPTEILRRLQQIGYARRQTIVMGNTADEASLALLALAQVGDSTARLYNGGMEEIRRRAAYLLTAKKRRRR